MNKSKKLLSMLTIALALSSAAPLYAEQNNSWFSWSTIGAATAVIGSFAGLGFWGWKAHTKAKKLEQDLSTAQSLISEKDEFFIQRSATVAKREANGKTIKNEQRQAAQQVREEEGKRALLIAQLRSALRRADTITAAHAALIQEKDQLIDESATTNWQIYLLRKQQQRLIQEKNELIAEFAKQQQKSAEEIKKHKRSSKKDARIIKTSYGR